MPDHIPLVLLNLVKSYRSDCLEKSCRFCANLVRSVHFGYQVSWPCEQSMSLSDGKNIQCMLV